MDNGSYPRSYLRDDLAAHWAPDNLLEAAFQLQGEVFRQVAGRRTLRVQLGDQWYFVKVHEGVGWAEVLKNWLQFKPPVVGAENEYHACLGLAEEGIRAPRVAAFAQSDDWPHQRRSFVLCDELAQHINLEEVAHLWMQQPPSPQAAHHLLTAVARFARRFHQAGFIHRDFYLCHLLLHQQDFAQLDQTVPELGVLDLHRARRFDKVPDRWLKRDLAALLFSSLDLPLSRRAWLRFVRIYSGRPLRDEMAERGAFWQQVKQRADKLYAEGRRKGIVAGNYNG